MVDQLSPVPAIDKMDLIFRCLSGSDAKLTQSEICVKTGLAKATVSRLVNSLQERGYLEQSASGFSLGPKLMVLGARAERGLDIASAAGPHIASLSGKIEEMVKVSVLRSGRVYPVASCESPSPIRITLDAGTVFPPHIGAAGKLLLALSREGQRYRQGLDDGSSLEARTPFSITSLSELDLAIEKVKENGIASDYQEETLGIYAVAAPVFNSRSEVIAALSVPFFGDFEQKRNDYMPLAVSCADDISRSMGYHPKEKQ